MVEDDRRALSEPEALRRLQPTMAGDDHPVAADQYRVGEAELHNRGGDLRDLALEMRPGIARIGREPGEERHHDLHGRVSEAWAGARPVVSTKWAGGHAPT